MALVVLSEPQTYPPTINAANILAEQGHRVFVYGIKYDTKDKIALHPNITMKYWGSQAKGIFNVLKYCTIYFRLLIDSFSKKFDWIIAYDAFAVGPTYITAKLRNIKWIYHQHDWWEQPIGLFQKTVNKLEFKWGSKATVVSFPQTKRAELYQQQTGMASLPLIVYNGPRLAWVAEPQPMHPFLQSIKNTYPNILVYQGGLSSYFGLQNLVAALPKHSANTALLFIGRELELGIINKLNAVAKEYKVEPNIFYWKEYVSYDALPAITSYCTVGIAKLTHNNMYAPINDKFIAGASNKIAEYMACSLPIIASNTDDNIAYYTPHNIGVLCNTNSVDAIVAALDTLLLNKQFAHTMGNNNKHNFNTIYNFDKQFQKIASIIAA